MDEGQSKAGNAHDDSESIRRWLVEFDAIPLWEMIAAEEADWQADRAAQRELERTRRRDFTDFKADEK